jgi:hypothetical protein
MEKEGRNVNTGECGIFQLFGRHDNKRCKMYEQIKPRITMAKKQYSTGRRLFSPANWTSV